MEKLTAKEGCLLHRKDDPKIIGEVFLLGVNDSPDNYIEIEKTEYETQLKMSENGRDQITSTDY